MTEYPKTDELIAAIAEWTRPLVDHPAFRQLARAKIGSALDWEDDFPRKGSAVREVVIPEPLSSQHDAVMQFYHLHDAVDRARQVEFYFRRYPFRQWQVSRHNHLENICSMYFSSYYVVGERLRVYLNALNKVTNGQKIEVGGALKSYQKQFKAELRERHSVTHSAPFDDTTIMAVMLHSVREINKPTERRAGSAYAYRKASREWAQHAKSSGQRVSSFLEAVAGASLKVGAFLKTPPTVAEDDLSIR